MIDTSVIRAERGGAAIRQAKLLPQHAQMLAASGIGQDMIDARGYRSIETKADLKRLGFGDAQCIVPTLVVPIWGVGGEIALYHHRPDTPRLREGKLAKYEFPHGAHMAVDVHPRLKEKVRDPNVPLFITEGVKKADAAVSRGLCCIALVGTWNWRGTNDAGGKTALPDWDSIALKDSANHPRQVYICYDSDVMLKPQVHEALSRLSGFLKKRGADIAYIYLPHGDGAAKIGLDDYLAAGNGVDDLMALVSPVLRDVEGTQKASPSQATRLVDIAARSGYELFHTPDGEAHATIDLGGHRETHLIRSKSFKRLMAQQFYAETGTAAGSQAVQDALSVLEGKAHFEGPEQSIHLRMAEHGGNCYIDLANERWEAVEISARGWKVVADAPVKFRRTPGMLALPTPTSGGSISELRKFINLPSDGDWLLLQAYIVAALRPTGPYPVLAVVAEQGSGKSLLFRIVRALVDPSTNPLRSEPRSTHDLMIAARNGWVLAFDNLSHIKNDLSDALCRLSTGGGFATRELYSDDSEVLFDAQRPVMLNGIEELTTRADLLERTLLLSLPSIPDSRRRPENTLWASFELARPRIFGAVLDAVSCAIRRLPEVSLPGLPRMADFAMWAIAAEPALDFTKTDGTDDTDAKPHTFLNAYTSNREQASSLALEASLLAQKLQGFLATQDSRTWTGTASTLLASLTDTLSEHEQRDRTWPKAANSLSSQFRRISPNLRKLGIDIQHERTGAEGTRKIVITNTRMAGNDRQHRQIGSATHAEGRATDDADDTPGRTDDEVLAIDDENVRYAAWDVLEAEVTDGTDGTDDVLLHSSNKPNKVAVT